MVSEKAGNYIYYIADRLKHSVPPLQYIYRGLGFKFSGQSTGSSRQRPGLDPQ